MATVIVTNRLYHLIIKDHAVIIKPALDVMEHGVRDDMVMFNENHGVISQSTIINHYRPMVFTICSTMEVTVRLGL